MDSKADGESMKVHLLVLNPFTNDARVYKTAKTLASAGYRVTVIALWEEGLDEIDEFSGFKIVRLKLANRKFRKGSLSRAARYVEYAWKIWQMASKDPADIYHANDAITLPAAWIATKRTSSRLVYDAHELETGRDFSNSTLSRIYRLFWALPEKIFIRRANTVITVSASIANELARLYRIPTPWIVMNCPEKRSSRKSNRLREELAIPDTYKIVLYQGQIARGRGIESLLEAIQPLSKVVAVVLGDGPMMAEFLSNVNQGKWKRVYLPGKVNLEDLLTYSSSADIGVVLTEDSCLNHHFSLPNKLFEYIQAGLPILGSDLPEIARVILENDLGEVINPGDIQGITKAISRMIDHRSSYLKMSSNSQKAADIYNWETESKKLLKAYHLIAEELRN